MHGFFACEVLHQRLHPKRHRFRYGLFYWWLDLDQLDLLNQLAPWAGYHRPALYQLKEEDHLTDYCPGNLKQRLAQVLADQGHRWDPATGKAWLMTHLRVLGYVFNPVSFYFCQNAQGQPVAAVVEVGNTFGELKPYVLPLTPAIRPSRQHQPSPTFHLKVPKQFYVSPFSEVVDWFDFRIHWPTEQGFFYTIDTHASNQPDDPPHLLSWLKSPALLPLNGLTLLKLTFRYPLVTVGVIGRIHWQALRLWLAQVPFFHKETAQSQQKNVLRPRPLVNRPGDGPHAKER